VGERERLPKLQPTILRTATLLVILVSATIEALDKELHLVKEMDLTKRPIERRRRRRERSSRTLLP